MHQSGGQAISSKTYPVGDLGATRLLYGDLGKWADVVRSDRKAASQFSLIHASTQRFDDLFAVLVPLTR